MRTRNWCVTSWTCPDYDSVERLVVSGEYKYVCVGKETCPRTGKVHWHWYLQAVNKKSMRQIKKDVGDRMAHAEAANGPADAGIAYVKKDGDWKEWGEPKKQGKRSDLEDCKKIIDNSVDDAMGTMQQIADTHFGDFVRYYRGFAKYADLVDIKRAKQREPHMPEVIVYLGRAGSGKSYHCYHDEGYQRSGYRYLVQMESKTYFDGYDGEKTIWFDEFSGRVMSFTVFTQIVDQWEAEWRPREDLDRSSQNDFLSPLWSGLPNGGLDLADLTLTPTNCIEESPRYIGAEDLDRNPWS